MAGQEVFISVDIEADGPIPGDYSMSSFGAVVVERDFARSLYRELKPISDRFDPEAAKVAGFDRAQLVAKGADPKRAMEDFARWVGSVVGYDRPVYVGFNAPFDWMFTHWYFLHFLGSDPFGSAALDVKAYYMGALGKRAWSETTKARLDPRFLSGKKHTHNALDDAIEQGEVFQKIRAFAESRSS